MIYLDNAATSLPKPTEVIEAMTQAINTLGNSDRGAHAAGLTASKIIYETRKQLADLFGAESPERIAFTSNATEALNTAILGTLEPGDHVITTAAEHNSVLRPLEHWGRGYVFTLPGIHQEQRDVSPQDAKMSTKPRPQVSIIPCDTLGNYDYAALEAAIRPDTKAIICTHASNVTGNVFDIARIGAIAKAHNLLFIVDAAQTAGILDISVQEMNIDILCFTGHKALLGPQGTGGLYVKPGVTVKPLKTGGSGVQTYSRTHPIEMPTALEAGTLNGHGIAGLHGALTYIKKTGIEKIREREQQLMWYLYERLREIPGIRVYGDYSPQPETAHQKGLIARPIRCPIVSFTIDGIDSAEIGDYLASEHGIATRTGGHCAPLMHEALGTVSTGVVRVSLSHYNTEAEIDCLIAALHELIN